MLIAVISDIHANLEALQAVMADIREQGAEAVYCLGDVVGYGADPSACLEIVRNQCQILLRGNHDAAVNDDLWLADMNWAAAAALRWTRSVLSAGERAEMAAWPLVRVSAEARLVHGSPEEPDQFRYVLSRWDVKNAFQAFPERLGFCGHTHQALAAEETAPGVIRPLAAHGIDLDSACRYLINVGSVGQPRDGRTEARYVLVHDQPPRVEFRFVAYPIVAAQEKIRRAGLPGFLAERLAQGR